MTMTPAEITQTKRMLVVARRNYVHYSMKSHRYNDRNEQPPTELTIGIEDCERTIRRLEADLIAAGVEVEI